mmetsp:Transcript_13784/g.39278  ORF Transcript_13784/g.39278 Transcript_13784/m.39278 type:complete len:203 (+) Transcript_13784:670-1278(+)
MLQQHAAAGRPDGEATRQGWLPILPRWISSHALLRPCGYKGRPERCILEAPSRSWPSSGSFGTIPPGLRRARRQSRDGCTSWKPALGLTTDVAAAGRRELKSMTEPDWSWRQCLPAPVRRIAGHGASYDSSCHAAASSRMRRTLLGRDATLTYSLLLMPALSRLQSCPATASRSLPTAGLRFAHLPSERIVEAGLLHCCCWR